MPEIDFKSYLRGFKSIKGVLASIGALVPGLTYFTKYAPPFGEIALLTAAFAAATVFITYYYSPPNSDQPTASLPPLIRRAVKILLLSFVLLVSYLIIVDLCSVQIPGTNSRVQIGFSQFDWTLTDYGKGLKRQDPTAQPSQWLDEEAFKAGAAKLFWKPWSIYAAGVLLILVFTTAFILWTFAWSLIAKQNALSRVENPPTAPTEANPLSQAADEPQT
jgi:hypothetical protein